MTKKKVLNKIEGEKNKKDLSKDFLKEHSIRLYTKPKTYMIASFDLETTGKGNDFFICGFMNVNGTYECYTDKVEAIDKLTKFSSGVLVYATNLGFDYNALTEGTDFKNLCEFILRGNNYIMVTFKGSYAKTKLLDSVNYGGLSVASMGKILKLPKLKSPRCLGKNPRSKKEFDELVVYNKRDCEVTKRFMELFQKTLNELGGELKSTISSCAMDLYRRKFLKFDIVKESLIINYVDLKPKIFKSYYGGRTETFKRGLIGKSPENPDGLFYYDFNNLYGSVMLNEYPNPTSVKYCREGGKQYLRFMGVSYFELQIPYSKYPLLPFRTKDKLIFPYGFIKGYYTHLEINKLISIHGESVVLLMEDTIYYTEKERFFKDYVETLYNLRQEYKRNNDEREVCVKLLINGLYGKWGQRNMESVEFFDFNNPLMIEKIKLALDEGKRVKTNSADEGYITSPEVFDGITSIPIWSVYTTAYARLKLYDKIIETKPVFCDTDSVITDVKLNDSKVLGEMKLEKMITWGVVIKPKLYFVNDDVKVKGVPIPKDEKQKIRLKKLILNEKRINYQKFIKIKEGISRNIKVNSIMTTSKFIKLEDTKRNWKGQKFDKDELQDSEPLEITKEYYIDKEDIRTTDLQKIEIFEDEEIEEND